jgi:hypothetical protein
LSTVHITHVIAAFAALGTLLLPGLVPGPAWADTVETALMPGQVIEGHAKWEDTCTTCHKRFDKAAQTTLCLDCHKDTRKDVDQKQGYHGRFKEQRECKDCHTEHKGRTENIAPITEETFDHAQTDFPLRGAHADVKKVECKACHKPKVKFREAPSSCYSCHKKDDKHKGRVGELCADCHTENAWKTIRFDHNKTKYPLRGKHADVACKACHAEDRYKNTPMDCYACHKKDDKHKGQEGTKCGDCHDDRSWKKTLFDHNKSRFPLVGKHAQVECKKCHLTPAFKDAPMDCYSCHKKDDTHKGSYGDKCETCHAASDWKAITFDHDLHTKYPLRGRHITTKCASCHKGSLYTDKTPADCYACHKKDDKHKGRFGDHCVACHTERDWKAILFDHDRDSLYPLKGYHRRVPCESCHKSPLYKEKTATDCYACHKKDDIHHARFGENCEKCHTEGAWKTLIFQHDRDTKYPLLGQHRMVTCHSCHTGRLYKDKTPADCYSCHKSNDIHRLKLGNRCEDCHNSRDWKLWDFNHDTRTKFKLDGKHKGLGCYDCHKTPMAKHLVASSACATCHKKDDKHAGGFGPQCEGCHETSEWRTLKQGTGGFRLR